MAKRCCRIYDFLIIDATAPFDLRFLNRIKNQLSISLLVSFQL